MFVKDTSAYSYVHTCCVCCANFITVLHLYVCTYILSRLIIISTLVAINNNNLQGKLWLLQKCSQNKQLYKNITFSPNTSCKSIGMEFLTQ